VEGQGKKKKKSVGGKEEIQCTHYDKPTQKAAGKEPYQPERKRTTK